MPRTPITEILNRKVTLKLVQHKDGMPNKLKIIGPRGKVLATVEAGGVWDHEGNYFGGSEGEALSFDQ